MTIEEELVSAQSGWYSDAKYGTQWRYGTERPCNLVGRYVTIYADYSAVEKPNEIALCYWGVMGNRTTYNYDP